jgi:hypothetical protein
MRGGFNVALQHTLNFQLYSLYFKLRFPLCVKDSLYFTYIRDNDEKQEEKQQELLKRHERLASSGKNIFIDV